MVINKIENWLLRKKHEIDMEKKRELDEIDRQWKKELSELESCK